MMSLKLKNYAKLANNKVTRMFDKQLHQFRTRNMVYYLYNRKKFISRVLQLISIENNDSIRYFVCVTEYAVNVHIQ